MTGAVRRVLLEIAGWGLLAIGVAALVLPGPGLLLIVAGLAVLSQQYPWAERRLEPMRLTALRAAAEGVATWPRIVLSCAGALTVAAFGVVWILDPDVPTWWPVHERWWLAGGAWTGVTMIASCLLALALIVYSYRRFHGKPEALEELAGELAEAEAEVREHRRDHD